MRHRFHACFASMLLVLALVIIGGATSADAQAMFANDSVIGAYAVKIETKFIREVGIGICTADGLPNATGLATLRCPNLIINQRDDDQGREVVMATLTGSYTINPDGTGTMSVVLQESGGAPRFTLNTNVDLLVTQSRTPTGNAVRDALAIYGAQVEGAHQITNLGGEEMVNYKFKKLE